MQRQIVPVLLVIAVVGAVVLLERPKLAGDLLALAASWDGLPGSQYGDAPMAPMAGAPPAPSMPVRPSMTARPESWPGGARNVAVTQVAPAPQQDNGYRQYARSPSQYSYQEAEPAGEAVVGDPPPRAPSPGARPEPPVVTPFVEDEQEPRSPVQSPTRRASPWTDGVGATNASSGPNANGVRQASVVSPTFPGMRNDFRADSFADRPYLPEAPVQGGPDPSEELNPCEGSQVVARVGSEVILLRDVSMGANEIRTKYKGQVPDAVLEAKAREIMQKELKRRIEAKLLCQDATRSFPAENLKGIKEMISKEFENAQVPRLMEQLKVGSRRELAEKMQQLGASLEHHKRGFMEEFLAQMWLREKVKPNEDIGREEMLAFYRDHASDFETAGRVRWEQLMIRKSGDPATARKRLCAMGNQVLDGAPLAEVAKASSEGATARQGGYRDWTNQGSLASKVLDRALFSPDLRPGQLSQIVEDDQGFHILRVIERVDPVRKSFVDAQVEIKKRIRKQREDEGKALYVAKLRKQIPVWTAFPEEEEIMSATGTQWIK